MIAHNCNMQPQIHKYYSAIINYVLLLTQFKQSAQFLIVYK